jgi:DNA-binding LacI/PurR family transcriptional regulator
MLKFNDGKRQHATRRVTQKEIARIAGVSHVAVSYALHRKLQSRISKEKQQEIRRIAHALGYQPRAMTTYTIALALPVHTLRLEFTSSLILTADEILREKGYRLTLAAIDDDVTTRGYLLDQKNADGVLLTDPRIDVSKVIAPNLPRILMADADEEHLTPDTEQVSMDTRETLKAVVSYAVQRGHRNLGLVASVQRSVYDNHLRQGFRAALKEHNLPVSNGHVIEVGGTDNTAGPLLRSLESQNPPTLIIAGSSARALYVLNTLQWSGYRVPEDISIISCTDSERLPLLHPKVTATSAGGHDVVSLAIERLLQRIEDPDTPAQRTLLPGTIIERESVSTLAPSKS